LSASIAQPEAVYHFRIEEETVATTRSTWQVRRLTRAVAKHAAGTLVGLREVIDGDTAEVAFEGDSKWHQIPVDAIEEVPEDQIPQNLQFGA